MAKKKATADELPESIRVVDQFGQPYDIDKENKLWPQALEQLQAGKDPVQFPMSEITSALEWGWWTCFQTQKDWLEKCGVPLPDHKVLFGIENGDNQTLREMLARFGGYVSYLEGQLGVLRGRAAALNKGYKAAILVHASKSEDKRATETSKEAAALASSETLRQTRRLEIEQETIIHTASGMLDGYIKAWETVSRVITTRTSEAELSTRRHA